MITGPVPESARRSLDAGHSSVFGMAAEDRGLLAECIQVVIVEEALVGEDHVQGNAAVALAENTAVAALPMRLLRSKSQDIVIEHPQDLD